MALREVVIAQDGSTNCCMCHLVPNNLILEDWEPEASNTDHARQANLQILLFTKGAIVFPNCKDERC